MKRSLLLILICLLLSGCKAKNTIDDKTIIIAASSSPHAEILEKTRSFIESRGYSLVVRVFGDYIIPNKVTDSGEVDANFFQHLPYLTNFNEKNKTNLVSVLKVHFEPLGLYQGKRSSLQDLTNAKIAIANDDSNGARGLWLLEEAGIIKLDHSKGLNVTKKDIIENKYNVIIIELEAAVIPSQLVDLDFAVINGNYALEAKIPASKVLLQESKESESASLYANIIAVRKGNENKEAITLLVEALMQVEVSDFINDTYHGVVVPLN